MAEPINSIGKLKIGDYFESCSFHPCICIGIDDSDRNIEGISLVDGHIQSCSVIHCGVRRITLEEAIIWKLYGPKETDVEIEKPWW
jgi:hypothetical protein